MPYFNLGVLVVRLNDGVLSRSVGAPCKSSIELALEAGYAFADQLWRTSLHAPASTPRRSYRGSVSRTTKRCPTAAAARSALSASTLRLISARTRRSGFGVVRTPAEGS
jgi:hypothetical protein